MNIYLSAQWARRAEIEGYALILRGRDHDVVSRWHHGEPMGNEATATPADWREWALADLQDVKKCGMFVTFTEPKGTMSRGGRHVEWGYAIAKGAELVVVGPLESQFYTLFTARYASPAQWLDDDAPRRAAR